MKDLVKELIEINSEIKYLSKIKDFSSLSGLLERYQTLANRLEATLWQQKDIRRLRDEYKELKSSKKELEDEIEKLESKKSELTGEPTPKSKKKNPHTYPFWED